MSNFITIELCKEDRQRLDEIIGFLGLIVGQKYSKQEALAVLDQTEQPAPVNEHPVDEVSPHVVPEPEAQPEVNYTRSDVHALAMKLSAPKPTGLDKKTETRAIIHEYALCISDIPEEKMNEVMAKLQKLAEEE